MIPADHEYMAQALTLAKQGIYTTQPNPRVGCVLVKDGKLVAEGFNQPIISHDATAHAEIMTLRAAGDRLGNYRLPDTELFVTLEPCYHYGRTTPCVDQIIKSGVKEVVIGMRDPNVLTNGKSILKLQRAGIKTSVGLLQKELNVMNEKFIKYTKTKMPFVAAKSAQSLDGKIALVTGESKWITSQQTRQFARRIRDEYDAILVGVNTVLKDNPRLNGVKKTRRLKKIILDSSLKISLRAHFFSGVHISDCIVVTSAKASKKKLAVFQKKGVNVIVCPIRNGMLDLKWLFHKLAKQEITSILIEGGARVIGRALRQKLVDKMYIYIAPKIFGDQNALSSVVDVNTKRIGDAIQLKKANFKKIGKDILVTGYV